MYGNRFETLPDTWDEARDAAFFRVVSTLFSPDFLYSASVLLATYDESPIALLG